MSAKVPLPRNPDKENRDPPGGGDLPLEGPKERIKKAVGEADQIMSDAEKRAEFDKERLAAYEDLEVQINVLRHHLRVIYRMMGQAELPDDLHTDFDRMIDEDLLKALASQPTLGEVIKDQSGPPEVITQETKDRRDRASATLNYRGNYAPKPRGTKMEGDPRIQHDPAGFKPDAKEKERAHA
jgi:curved DNA-binding protein CbpA